ALLLVVFLMLAGEEAEQLDVATVKEHGPLWSAAYSGLRERLAGPFGLERPRVVDGREFRCEGVLPAAGKVACVNEYRDRVARSVPQERPVPEAKFVLHEFPVEGPEADVDQAPAIIFVQGKCGRASPVGALVE